MFIGGPSYGIQEKQGNEKVDIGLPGLKIREAKSCLQNYHFCLARYVDLILHRKLLRKEKISVEPFKSN